MLITGCKPLYNVPVTEAVIPIPRQRMRWLIDSGLVRWVLCVQGSVAITALLAAMWWGESVGSVIAGSISSLLPNMYFLVRLSASRTPQRSVADQWIAAEITKLIMVAALFLAAIVLLDPLDIVVCCITFIIVHWSAVVAAIILDYYSHGQPVRSR